MKKRIYIFFCFLFVGITVQAQLRAFTDASSVELGEIFEFTVESKNLRGNFGKLNFKGFEVVSGPNRTSSTVIVNGQVRSSMEYSYELRAQKIGTFTLPVATFKTQAGKIIKSNKLTIKVTKAAASSAMTLNDLQEEIGQDVFLKLNLPEGPFYPGQQIIANLDIYTSVAIKSFQTVKTAVELPGCTVIPVRQYKSSVKELALDSKQYLVKTIARYAIFPVQTGDYEIDSLSYKVYIPTKQRRSKIAIIHSKPVPFKVEQIPDMPADFCGAVGDFSGKIALNRPSKLSTDDAFTIQLRISGNGDMDQITSPVLNLGDTFKVYDPEVMAEERYESGGEIFFERIYGYQITPRAAGDFTVVPTVEAFNPDSSKFYTAVVDTFRFPVLQGKNKQSEVLASNDSEVERFTSIIPLGKVEAVKDVSFLQTSKVWYLFSAPILVIVGLIGFKKYQDQKPEVDLVAQKFDAAKALANERLKKAATLMKSGDGRAFYDEIIHAVYGYLGDKCQLPPSELDKPKIKDYLQSNQVDQSVIDKLLSVIKQCEMGIYAGQAKQSNLDEVYADTNECIAVLEAHFTKK